MNKKSSKEVKCYVLDSYAVLAYLQEETGHEKVLAMLEEAREGQSKLLMSAINFGEILYIVEREKGLPKAQQTLACIDELPIEVVDADRTITLAAAHLKAQHSLAYADCFAAGLAQLKKAVLVSGDPELERVESLITIEWLPRKGKSS